MNIYSSADMLNKELHINVEQNKNIKTMFNSFICSFKRSVELEINIPTTIYLRTKQICTYIEEMVGYNISVGDFLMALYLEFVDSSIIDKDIFSIYKIIDTPNSTDTIKISNGTNTWECELKERKKCTVTIDIGKKDLLRGELLLAEIHELYGRYFSIENVIATIWINFITNFLKGNNKDVLEALIDILKKRI
jgi:hypothetical protein